MIKSKIECKSNYKLQHNIAMTKSVISKIIKNSRSWKYIYVIYTINCYEIHLFGIENVFQVACIKTWKGTTTEIFWQFLPFISCEQRNAVSRNIGNNIEICFEFFNTGFLLNVPVRKSKVWKFFSLSLSILGRFSYIPLKITYPPIFSNQQP